MELICLCFSYLIMENVRYMLSQYRHETSLYFGCRFILESTMEGYMAGGGYILSKKALSKLNENILPNEHKCRSDNEGAEDLEMGNYYSFELMLFTFLIQIHSSGKCLENTTIFVDTRDEQNQMRFFPD